MEFAFFAITSGSLTWPRPCLERPLFLRFLVILVLSAPQIAWGRGERADRLEPPDLGKGPSKPSVVISTAPIEAARDPHSSHLAMQLSGITTKSGP